MSSQNHYLISYLFKGQQQAFSQKDSHMSDADAWYYSALHSGAGVVYGIDATKGTGNEVRLHAQRCGVTEVTWRRLPE